jgi:hypothetical protein
MLQRPSVDRKKLVKYLYSRVAASQWVSPKSDRSSRDWSGVLIRKSRENYVSSPANLDPILLAAAQKLNVQVAFTMRTDTVDTILSTLEPFQTDLLMTNGSQLQVLDSLQDIATMNVKRFQYAALFRNEGMLLVWHDDLQQILPHALQLEEKLLSLVRNAAH